jgi:hypothetical protein
VNSPSFHSSSPSSSSVEKMKKRKTKGSSHVHHTDDDGRTAVMFFKHKNGSYHRIPQVGNGGPQGRLINKGGLDVYYIPSGRTTAFKPVSLFERLTLCPSFCILTWEYPGLPYACWQCCRDRRQQGLQGQHLPPLLDIDQRGPVHRWCSLHWQRYRCHPPEPELQDDPPDNHLPSVIIPPPPILPLCEIA